MVYHVISAYIMLVYEYDYVHHTHIHDNRHAYTYTCIILFIIIIFIPYTHLPCLSASSVRFVVGYGVVEVLQYTILYGHHVVHENRRVIDVAISLF